ncbi:unnamed protein product [Cylicostephanus goldi]|uniref:Uncharacterized protein n=1 Tax=Cylicostephanus goldi TaxID=71465 RepID=A0A3P6RSP0_CYLGO|nr:unnamed protein product [Cylicostephanus goldi]
MLEYLLLCTLISNGYCFTCKDQKNDPVEWFAVYKMPMENADNSVPGIQKGVAWYYVDSNNKGALTPSQKTLDDKDQAIAYTLNQYYAKQFDPTIFHVMYNDEVSSSLKFVFHFLE